jgi:hypothetical protein
MFAKIAASLLSIPLLVGAGHAVAQSARNAISVGAGIHPLGTVAPVVQYERLLNDMVSIGGRFLRLDYTYDDGRYHETGDGTGGEILVHVYFRNQGFKGPYIAAGIGQFSVDWDWTDPPSNPNRGSGKTSGAEVSATFGWKIPLTPNFFLDPSITLGNFFGSAKDSTGSKESQLGFYGAAMFKIGFTF